MKKITFFIILIGCPFIFYAQTYNPKAALDYADRWWDGRNTNNWIKHIDNHQMPSLGIVLIVLKMKVKKK